jgi:hypothetical protein
MAEDFAVLVLSCDRYADVWPAFFQCFRRNFPAGPWPVYVGSNTVTCQEPGVKTLLSGEDRDWSTSFRRILEQIPERKLFVILEDLLAATPVDPARLQDTIRFVMENDANYLRYWTGTVVDEATSHPGIGKFARGAPYRATVCAFWDREYLMRLLIDGENPWNFEILGSYRTSYSDGFYGLREPLFRAINTIEKGSWMPQSVQAARRLGVELDLRARPVLAGRRQLASRLKMAIFRGVIRISWRRRVRWMNALRKALVSY